MTNKLQIYLDKDIDKNLIKTKKIAIIGFGSQGYGQSMNLKESGCDVVLGLRLGGKSDVKARDYGFKTMSIEDAVKVADIIQILIPDEIQAKIYEEQIKPYMRKGQYLMFSHGFNIHYKKIVAPEGVNVIMVAPKGPGHTVRSEYQIGRGVPSLIAVYQDPAGNSKEIALSYASAIGAGRAGIIETTFKEETETDLFGEQAVLCGGLTALINAGFQTLVEAGYQPEIAYFETCHEVKLIVDDIYEHGFGGMWKDVSNTAEYGGLTRRDYVITEETKKGMKKVLSEIQDGTFKKQFADENATDAANLKEMRAAEDQETIEVVGERLRKACGLQKDD